MSLEHSPFLLTKLEHSSTTFPPPLLLAYTLKRIRRHINRLRITYKLNVLSSTYSYSTNIAEAKRSFVEAARYATFLVEFQSYLNLSQSFNKVPMLTVYEFKLNYTKTQHSGHFGHTCTGTPWTCTGTGCILLACTGTGWTCTGIGWPLVACTGTALYLYRYTLGNLPKNASFLPLLLSILSIQLPHSLILQKSSWKSSNTTSQHLNW